MNEGISQEIRKRIPVAISRGNPEENFGRLSDENLGDKLKRSFQRNINREIL